MSRWSPSARRTGRRVATAALGGSLLLLAAPAVGAGAQDTSEFDAPSSGVVVGAHLFVTNSAGNSVTEVNARTGAYVSTISGSPYDFSDPTAIVAYENRVFVSNGTGDSLTEFTAGSGAFVRTIAGAPYGFSDPIAMTTVLGHLFVLNAGGSVTEVGSAQGNLLGVSSGAAFGFSGPNAIGAAGDEVYVTNGADDTVTVIDAHDRRLVTVLTNTSGGFEFADPSGVAYDGTHVWIANQTGGSMTEITAATNQLDQVVVNGNLPTPAPSTYGDGYVFTASPPGSSPMITQITASTASVNWMMCNTNGPYLFDNPQALVVAGPDLWVVNEGGNALTEMDASTGALLGTFPSGQ